MHAAQLKEMATLSLAMTNYTKQKGEAKWLPLFVELS